MTVQELYTAIGADYGEACSRLMNDKIIGKFIIKFLDDKSYQTLATAWEAGDENEAFEGAHALKGVCGNLALTKISKTVGEITEALRPGNAGMREQTDVGALMQTLSADYAQVVGEIKKYAAENAAG